jgi:cyclohexa-1,5-dienecarbonyl-CoA hydratase
MIPLQVRAERDGQVQRLTLARPKANLLDAELIGALRDAVRDLTASGPLKLVLLDHEGPHFSFGASVEEHLPGAVRGMLQEFHGLFRDLDQLGVPIAAVVHGQCLGGGLELALLAGRVFVDPSARMGLPEIRLGVFPPVGAVLLPLRIGVAAATDQVLSGASVDGETAARIGLADSCTADPRAAALAWFDETLALRSAASVRQAWQAVRRPYGRALGAELAAVETQYLEELMALRDPEEGLRAFLASREPTWEHA